MNTDNPRDTHFSGFAQAVVEEMYKLEFWIEPGLEYDDMRQAFADIIARRAYDLVLHTVWQTIPASGSTIKKYQGLTIEEIAAMIPDLPELPEEQ